MERPFFQRVSAPTPKSHDTAPLLSRNQQLKPLPPKPYTDDSSTRSQSPLQSARSASPITSAVGPRFLDSRSSSANNVNLLRSQDSPSPTRTRISRAYNYDQSIYSHDEPSTEVAMGIPPPITQSVFLTTSSVPAVTEASNRGSSRIRFRPESPAASRSPGQRRSIYALPIKAGNAVRARQVPTYVTALLREEKAIQRDVQTLLDAQATALMKGRAGSGLGDDASSEGGSSTPTAGQSGFLTGSQELRKRGGGVVPVRQPKAKKISLKNARAGISQALRDLENAKIRQGEAVQGAMAHITHATRRLAELQSRSADFEREVKEINAGPESREIADLQGEKDAVAGEIRELEDRLLALRAKEMHLERRAEEVQNKRNAKLSSFVEAKKAIDGDLQRFLRKPDVDVEDAAALVGSLPMRKQVDEVEETVLFLDLPPQRRTAVMASTFLANLESSLTRISEATNAEKSALQAGQTLWDSTLGSVQNFEADMKKQMQDLSTSNPADALKNQILKMDGVMSEMEAKFGEAERAGWTLLICAIRAELEAFREGRELLADVLVQMGGTMDDFQGQDGKSCSKAEDSANEANNSSQHSIQQPVSRDASNGLDELLDEGAFHTAPSSSILHPAGSSSIRMSSSQAGRENKYENTGESSRVNNEKVDNSESEDDGPHPDLLTELDADD